LAVDFVPIVFGLVGGLALFLYGMSLLSRGLQKAAGDRLRLWIEKLTRSRLRGVGVGALVTAVIQSSSITTVTLVGLINAGLLSLGQAVPIIMGANIGTTLTAQLIAFKVGALALPIIAVGFALTVLGRKASHRYFGQVILGFGLLFLGMNTMSGAVKPLRTDPSMMALLSGLGSPPIFGISVGAIFTAIIQSSSATSGLVIAMASENLLDLPAAIAIIIGANIGTCATVLLASIGSTLTSKRAALSHILFNLIGAAIFFAVFSPFVSLVSLTSNELPRQIANAHLIFNVSATLLMLPFVAALVFAVKALLPGKEIKIDGGVRFLDRRLLSTPGIALSQAEKEAERLGRMSLAALDDAIRAFKESDLGLAKVVQKREDAVDELDDAIEAFLVKLTRRELSKAQAKRVSALVHSISDIERVSDHANNIAELAERKAKEKLSFSKPALRELDVMFRKSRESFAKSVNVLVSGNKKLARQVMALEGEIDGLQAEFEHNNFERTSSKKCNAKASVVFAELIRNLERVSDHAHNISMATTFGF
jgi:phosphate:Na+ symporter